MEVKTTEFLINGIKTPIDQCSSIGNSNDEEAIVFIHGNSGSSKDWSDFLPQSAKIARTIAIDMPGYGRSQRSKKFTYTVESYANHIHATVKALGIEKVHLVLHDFGGAWGLKFAADHPGLVSSIVLVNIGILPGYRWHKYARIWQTPILGELFQLLATKWAFRFLLNRDNPKPFPKAFIDRMFKDSDWGMSRGMLKLYRSTNSLGKLTENLSEALKRQNYPALVLWGDCDKYIPVRFADSQHDYFDAEIKRLPGCGHWPMIDNPKLFSSYLIAFLTKQIKAAN